MKRLLVIPFSMLISSLLGKPLPDRVDFNDDIQPIISENCYHCHGPDSSTRTPKKNPLRLDREDSAFLTRPSGKPAIIKGDAEASEVFQRIISKDLDDVMPPPESHKKPLNPDEVALIKRWIDQGAQYEEHWSFIPPARPDPPKIDWGNNPIDQFVAAKRREKGLEASPPGDPSRLFRRLTFDLTGLPPTPEEVASFREMAAKDLSTALEMTIGKLLTTEAYAEHFGRHWLDAARYADTHGIHIDNYRGIWPYRDWVIAAFAKNMRFDQFTREQIAGDLLPNPTLDQQIATGFNRCLPTTGEGGAIDKEYEAIYAADQVSTTSAIWLGLSTGCAACHDHKFDPISQKDFYALTAFFRNTTMEAMDRNRPDPAPVVFAPRKGDRERFLTVAKDLTTVEKQIQERRQQAQGDFKTWLARQTLTPSPSDPSDAIADTQLSLTLNGSKISTQGKEPFQEWEFKGEKREIEPSSQVPILSNTNINLGDLFRFEARDQITFSGQIYLEDAATGPLLSRMDTGADYRGWDLWIEDGKLGAHLVEKWPEQAIKGVTSEPLKLKQWHHFALIYDGKAGPKKSLTIFLNGKAMPVAYSHSSKVGTLETETPTRLGARHPDARLTGSASLSALQFFRKKLSNDEISKRARKWSLNRLLAIPADERDKNQTEALFDYYMEQFDGPTQALVTQKNELTTEQDQLKKNGSTTLVMAEKPGDAYAHILERGDYTLERDKVLAAIPDVFDFDQSDRKLSRADLADWLVSEKNPLTARVTVNRLWYYFFGRGIVETTEDFGIMGAQPTHPKLLDYLAVEFVESGWNLQHVIKLITTSATYQQAQKTSSANRDKDSENLYFWRGPRYRLEAEQIRDLALAASGLLVNKIGGPSVKPYQPEGVWESVAMKGSNTRVYQQDKGEGLYRRSLYTIWKRTAAPPNMEIFDAPSREVFCVRRDRTNTPLAAFVTMNDPQFVEAARALASTTIKQNPSFSQRLDLITMALMARTFDNEEQEVVKKTLDHHLTYYQKSPELAAQLITVGDSTPDRSLDTPELAAWTLITSQIFNLDETLTK